MANHGSAVTYRRPIILSYRKYDILAYSKLYHLLKAVRTHNLKEMSIFIIMLNDKINISTFYKVTRGFYSNYI